VLANGQSNRPLQEGLLLLDGLSRYDAFAAMSVAANDLPASHAMPCPPPTSTDLFYENR